MCVLIVKEEGVKLPSLATLRACHEANPDGCGFACKGEVFKGLDFDDFLFNLYENVGDDDSCVIHFRFATHGSVKPGNCHPFLDEKSGIVFAHNGILPNQSRNDMTDSEIFFRNVALPAIEKYGIDSPRFKSIVRTWIGWSKFAFMLPNGELRRFGAFSMADDEECLFSNLRWQTKKNYTFYFENIK